MRCRHRRRDARDVHSLLDYHNAPLPEPAAQTARAKAGTRHYLNSHTGPVPNVCPRSCGAWRRVRRLINVLRDRIMDRGRNGIPRVSRPWRQTAAVAPSGRLRDDRTARRTCLRHTDPARRDCAPPRAGLYLSHGVDVRLERTYLVRPARARERAQATADGAQGPGKRSATSCQKAKC